MAELCLGTSVPTHYARDLRNVYSNTRPGYSFLSEPENNLPAQYLWDALLRSPDLRAKYFHGHSVIASRAHEYLRSSTRLLEGLFLLMHLTYGSPARMTEINTWKHTIPSEHILSHEGAYFSGVVQQNHIAHRDGAGYRPSCTGAARSPFPELLDLHTATGKLLTGALYKAEKEPDPVCVPAVSFLWQQGKVWSRATTSHIRATDGGVEDLTFRRFSARIAPGIGGIPRPACWSRQG
ncbi:hypothetical protein V1525DRAFT_74390 [Lipomyces kononenkoae]|uniref:Uncharacterized protein n=1 Tax=Lipomyces kononenkoae TaxID=34357 RepID=A0ACC3STX5_LIPKO